MPFIQDNEFFPELSGKPGTYIALVDRGLDLSLWFDQLYREYTEKRLGYETSMFGILLQVMTHLIRLTTPNVHATSTEKLQGNGSVGFSAIIAYIDSHATEPLKLEQLASRINMSTRNFIRLFRKATGMGFSDYMQLKRIEFACRLLYSTDEKISYIALTAGYKDLGHFRKIFRKLMGVNPNEYRKNRAGTD
ncbi:AraC family transcriptional regulator [Paenibacillus amylolyticus]|uniref:AraC family transcriptional regulator n=1 Tax=Paenibacillus amylolyticus TaxID=1451 RepID=UPI00324238CF